jgi:hypothetical protein
MSQIDDFARSLLEEAKRFLEKADDDGEPAANDAYLHAALMLAFCSLEAHVNSIGDDFMSRPEALSLHEQGVLLEQEVRLEGGEFKLRSNLRMIRLEDRIRFLLVRFGKGVDLQMQHWSHLADATKLRNQLTHPKEAIIITSTTVGRAIQAIIDTLDCLYRAIYKEGFPSAGRGLKSRLDF